MFSLRNKEMRPPFKALPTDQTVTYAIYVENSYGPTFGSGHDFHISDNAGSNSNSYAGFNNQYPAPSGVSDTSTILAGSYNFQPSEVEVFYIVQN